MNSISLETLRDGLDGISSAFGGYMCDCAIVCFGSQNHSTGVNLNVILEKDGSKNNNFSIEWLTSLSDSDLKSYKDTNRTTDYGAMALAVLFVIHFTSYSSFETSATGSGIDFWLSNSDDLNFLSGARLEVSGIRKASTNNSLEKRLQIKLSQTNKSDGTYLSAYVAIIEFSNPKGAFIQK